jgi:hypothetical protein
LNLICDHAVASHGLRPSCVRAPAFAVDLDTHELFAPVGDAPLDATAHLELREVADHLDDDVLDAIARVWEMGKGQQPLPEPGADGAKIEIEGRRPGDPVVWYNARPSLRGDTYVLASASSRQSNSTA